MRNKGLLIWSGARLRVRVTTTLHEGAIFDILQRGHDEKRNMVSHLFRRRRRHFCRFSAAGAHQRLDSRAPRYVRCLLYWRATWGGARPWSRSCYGAASNAPAQTLARTRNHCSVRSQRSGLWRLVVDRSSRWSGFPGTLVPGRRTDAGPGTCGPGVGAQRRKLCARRAEVPSGGPGSRRLPKGSRRAPFPLGPGLRAPANGGP